MQNHLISCPVFTKELAAVLPEIANGPTVKFN
jgi:hypothetical protein